MVEPARDPTESLAAHLGGDPKAAAELLPLVYDELRALARRYMQAERKGHTLQPTALVHEAYLKLIDNSRIDWQGKTHFYALAATEMRRVLIGHARRRKAAKRSGQKVTLDERFGLTGQTPLDALAVEQALERLAQASTRQCRVVELRIFGGLSVEEAALVLGVSPRTVKQDWRVAKAWLRRELAPVTKGAAGGDEGS